LGPTYVSGKKRLLKSSLFSAPIVSSMRQLARRDASSRIS
jgi:hypothetical protein